GLGHNFRTESDTEVLLHAIDEWGWSALDQFEGMWAFALYDEAGESLWLSRDRFGEKPLFYYEDATGLYFGSEPKFIPAISGGRLDVNLRHLYRYLVNGYKSLYKSDETFFSGLKEIQPSNVVQICFGSQPRPQKYWNPRFESREDRSYEEDVAEIRDLLIRSV